MSEQRYTAEMADAHLRARREEEAARERQRRERAEKESARRAWVEEARGLEDYAHLRRKGVRDPVELHMNRVYGRLQGGAGP